MSNFLALYDVIKATDVAIVASNIPDGQTTPYTLPCDNLDEAKSTYEDVELPRRILTPLGAGDEGRNGTFITLGKQFAFDWVITEFMLWNKVTDELRFAEFGKPLAEFCAVHAMAFREKRSFYEVADGKNAVLMSLDYQPQPIGWPFDSAQQRMYAGVIVTFLIREWVSTA